MHTFDTPEPVRLAVTNGAGQVTIEAVDTAETTVTLTPLHADARDLIAKAIVHQQGDDITVRLPRSRPGIFRNHGAGVAVDVRVPTGSTAKVELDAADLRTTGELAELFAKLGSGDAAIDVVTGNARVETGSGDIALERCGGDLRAASGSGDFAVGTVGGRAMTQTGSGDVSIQVAGGEVVAGSGSGDITVGTSEVGLGAKTGTGDVRIIQASAGEVRASTASGDVEVGVKDGTAVWLDLNSVTGDVRSSLDSIDQPADSDQQLRLRVKTATGDITVARA